MGGGIPLNHQGVFAFLGFKISDLVHNIGEFDDVQPLRKELEGRVFEFLEFKISDLVHTFGDF